MTFRARVWKLFRIGCAARYVRALRLGVAAAVEHETVLRQIDCRTVVDVGANRGQFALVARQCFPRATIVSFEPLPGPAKRFRRVFAGDAQVRLRETAIGPKSGMETIHVSGRDDSSSFLAITALQDHIFPGTAEVQKQSLEMGPLSKFVSSMDIALPALLKLDVQGYELEALKGCEDLLDRFAYVYVECSFLELYAGQAGASEVIGFLYEHGFELRGVYNVLYCRRGRAVQADLFLSR